MSVQRKRYSAELKARVALEAIKGQKTANEIAAESECTQHRLPSGRNKRSMAYPNCSHWDARSKKKARKRSSPVSTNKSAN